MRNRRPQNFSAGVFMRADEVAFTGSRMIDSQDDPFAFNPYVAPEIHERGAVDPVTDARGSVWKWIAAAPFIDAVMTLVMVTLHDSSPKVRGLNVFAIANLLLSGVLSVTFGWLLGRRSSGTQAILIAQFVNLMIWLTFGTIMHIRFEIRSTGDYSLLLTSMVTSAMLALIASLASSGAFRSRSAKQSD
jgi:hypothetical protein